MSNNDAVAQATVNAANAGAAAEKPANDEGRVESGSAQISDDVVKKIRALDGMAAKIRKLEERLDAVLKQSQEQPQRKKTQAEMEYEELKRQMAELQAQRKRDMDLLRRASIRSAFVASGLPEQAAEFLVGGVLFRYGDAIQIDENNRVVYREGDVSEPIEKFMERLIDSDGVRVLLTGKRAPSLSSVPRASHSAPEQPEMIFAPDKGIPVIPASTFRKKKE